MGLWNEDGGRWVREQHGNLSLPLMVRPNTVLPVGAVEDRPDYDYADGVILHLFELESGRTALGCIPAPDGSVALTAEVRREGNRLDVQVQGAAPTGGRPPWSILLRGIERVASVEGGTAQQRAIGTRVVPDAGAQAVSVRLEESL